MKIIACLLICTVCTISVQAQSPAPAVKGEVYGTEINAEGAIPVNQLPAKMNKGNYSGKITGKVTEVCQEKGCWMKLEKSNGENLMVKFKDYGFFMPKDIVGKDVVLEGEAISKEVSVKQLRHYAEDAGKSKEEIEKINAPRKETQFVAKGVLVL